MIGKVLHGLRNITRFSKYRSNNPEYTRKRIFGTEQEYGSTGFQLENLEFIDNGGKLYIDCSHQEYASPETSNPRDAVLYSKAGDVIVQRLADAQKQKDSNRNPKIYKNVRDSTKFSGGMDGNRGSYGSHENYFCKIDPDSDEALKLLPFLVTRQIFTGSGYLYEDGFYELSQKSQYIDSCVSPDTTYSKAIINTRNESHSNFKDWFRLHITFGDANMCEVAEYLKFGTTALVISLIEDGKIPEKNTLSKYYSSNALHDLKKISREQKDWKLFDLNLGAIDIQRMYFDLAAKHYAGKDSMTDNILRKWDEVLECLERKPEDLFGVVDWITKKYLIDEIASKNNIKNIGSDPRTYNINLQYHDVNPEAGLFYALQKKGLIDRILTDDEIYLAADNPPKDTRAFYRTALLKYLRGSPNSHYILSLDWAGLTSFRNGQTVNGHTVNLDDPFDNHAKEQEELVNHTFAGW